MNLGSYQSTDIIVGILRHGGLDDFPVNPYQRLKQKLGLISPASGLQPQGLFVRLFTFKLLCRH